MTKAGNQSNKGLTAEKFDWRICFDRLFCKCCSTNGSGYLFQWLAAVKACNKNNDKFAQSAEKLSPEGIGGEQWIELVKCCLEKPYKGLICCTKIVMKEKLEWRVRPKF